MDFYNAAGGIQNPDILKSYIQGQMAPLQVQAMRNENAAAPYKLDQLRMAVENQRMYQNIARQALGQQGTQSAGAQSAQMGTGGIQNGPQQSVASDSIGASGPTENAVGGFQPNTLSALALLRGEDPLKTAQGVQNYQIEQRKLQAQGPLALYGSVADSQSPARIMMNNPGLMQRWQQTAPSLGLDPVKDFNDQNVRQVVTLAYNQLAGGASLPTRPMPVMNEQVSGPNGQMLSRNPVSGDVKQEVAQESLHPVIGPNGKPALLPSSQAVGLEPYTPANVVNQGAAGQIADAISHYKMAPLSGFALKSPQGQETMRQVMALNPDYDATQYQAKQKAYSQFTSGKQGDTVRSLSVATSHLDTLSSLVDAMDNGDVRLLNSARNRFEQETGSAAPTNFDTAKNVVADEVTKAIIGGGGGVGDREKAAAVIDRANSPQALKGAIQTYKTLMTGQLEGLQRQYQKATGRDDFNDLLSPAARSEISGQSQQQTAPAAAIAHLKQHPELADQFKSKYGYLPDGR